MPPENHEPTDANQPPATQPTNEIALNATLGAELISNKLALEEDVILD